MIGKVSGDPHTQTPHEVNVVACGCGQLKSCMSYAVRPGLHVVPHQLYPGGRRRRGLELYPGEEEEEEEEEGVRTLPPGGGGG